MSRQPFSILLSAFAWAGFIAVMLWTTAFLAGGIPRGVEGPAAHEHGGRGDD
jgi:hypothetical protein